ncbi:crotonase/enoyl-CoA hydratase family protein [Reichenbachiella carrageenanivorans]|uniref:Crotonase/enoyl-CoA hydratase family protein n=1 Tax=Reichenbachiella carrageenanivorans TaxID=2979869 RepID=A0ABY6D7D7_9BACT|nr:crotonase/enoyl-CoA hydratase family protein [Reichenbachiella carrageenanivorans]UXX81063.1 crotonase/enoyl-CoA hydratase family protein [Reichenbachiella carrageenanivorans]
MSHSFVTTKIKKHVLHIVLNRAEKMNAFTYAMLQELSDAYTQMENDSDIRCGLLYAHGDHFTTGLDLADVSKHIQKGATLFAEGNIDPLQVFDKNRTKPVVIAVHGHCLTIGIEMILASDICVAGENTKLGQIEVKRGILAFGGATLRFHQRCGWGNAMKYLLTGDTFDAQEALRIGLVQQVAADPIVAATALAERIAQQAPLAVQATLASAKTALLDGQEAAEKQLMPTLHHLMQTSDAQEGLMSFLERRTAKFEGK